MKGKSWHWLILALILLVVGIGTFVYKAYVLGFPVTPNMEETTWTVQARLTVEPRGGPVKVNLLLPHQVPGFERLEQSFVSKGFGRATLEQDGDRVAEWTIRRLPESRNLYYRAVFFQERRNTGWTDTPPYPEAPELEEPFSSALEAIIEDVRARSADIESFAFRVLERLNDSTPDENTQIFQARDEGTRDKVLTAVEILAGARIPATIVRGVRLVEERRRVDVESYLAVHNGSRWIYFNPEDGSRGVPDDVFLWWRGNRPVAVAEGAEITDVRFSVRHNPIGSQELAIERAKRRDSVFHNLSLLNLPVESQAVYGILLMVPLGALIIVVLRNLIGVRTFGTFMPVLIAMSFRETELLKGLLLFSFVVALGLAIRFYLEHIRLLLVPRLAAVLTIVVLLMVATSLASHSIGFEVGLSVSLFPMVIMAMTIERMSIVWDERGPAEAIRDGVGSLIIAAAAFLLMDLEIVQHLTFMFPELLLGVLGIIIMLGRYTGYRLSELGRFRKVVDFSGSRRHGSV